MKRRKFLKTAAVSSAVVGVGAIGVAQFSDRTNNLPSAPNKPSSSNRPRALKKPPVPAGYFVLAHPGNSRISLEGEEKGAYVVVNAHTGEFRHEKTNLFKAHAGHRPAHNNPEKLSYFVGHNDPGQIEVYDADIRRVKTLMFEDVLFRGHIVDHGDTMLATAIEASEPRYETTFTRDVVIAGIKVLKLTEYFVPS